MCVFVCLRSYLRNYTSDLRQFFCACYLWPWWVADVAICLERGADLHMAQLIPLPLTVSCFSKIQIGFTFLVPAHPGSPGKRAAKRVSCTCGRGSILLWRRSGTSGLWTRHFAHKPRLLDVAAQLKRSAHAALGLAIKCADNKAVIDRRRRPGVAIYWYSYFKHTSFSCRHIRKNIMS